MNLLTTFTVLEHTTAPRAKYAIPAERVYRMTPAVSVVTITLDCVAVMLFSTKKSLRVLCPAHAQGYNCILPR